MISGPLMPDSLAIMTKGRSRMLITWERMARVGKAHAVTETISPICVTSISFGSVSEEAIRIRIRKAGMVSTTSTIEVTTLSKTLPA